MKLFQGGIPAKEKPRVAKKLLASFRRCRYTVIHRMLEPFRGGVINDLRARGMLCKVIQMTNSNQATKTIPGKFFGVKIEPVVQEKTVGPTGGTCAADFAVVKDLLSNKPLRRPNRTRPIN